MKNNLKISKIKIDYKNNEESRNKLIDFIISFLIENPYIIGDKHE